MNDKTLSYIGIALTILFGVPTWWAFVMDYPETTAPLLSALHVLGFLATTLLAGFAGWHLCKWRRVAPWRGGSAINRLIQAMGSHTSKSGQPAVRSVAI